MITLRRVTSKPVASTITDPITDTVTDTQAQRPSKSLAERLVDKVATLLDRPKSTRRSFLTRTAVVGSALAVDPWGFTVKPVSAYSSICGSANTCSGGFTVFCCTIYKGANKCPPGSFAAGWWKADSSAFCCGAARYYIDCNAACGSGWGCRCNNTSSTCDQRLVACNQFRYGQCHQEVACYGPVVCRLITCTPPWQFTSVCTSASATDNSTADHSAPCLPGYCPSPIQRLYFDLGGPGSILGPVTQPERADLSGKGRYELFLLGAIYWAAPTGAHEVHGDILTLYNRLNSVHGVLGYPTTSTLTAFDGVGRYNHFQRGTIFYTPSLGAHEIHLDIQTKYASMGWYESVLGYPISNTWHAGSGSSYGAASSFEHGGIYTGAPGTHEVHLHIYDKYVAMGSMTSPLGLPVSDTWHAGSGSSYAAVSSFQNGAIYEGAPGVRAIWGAIYVKYVGLGSMNSPLGLPTTDLYVSGSVERVDFQHGWITHDRTTGVVTVHYS